MNIDINLEDNSFKDDVVQKKNEFWKKFIIYVSIILFVIFLIIIYARYKATTGIKVNEYKVTNSLITDNFHGTKVVHFSDIHYGNTVDLDYLKEIVNTINRLDADIVVFTGDLLDKQIDVDAKNNVILF